MLTQEQIQHNKEEFIAFIRSIKREGANIEGLVNKLENSDFFTAPASSKYHGAYEGGLCEHSLNVYYNLLKTVQGCKKLDEVCYDEDTLKIVALLHDLSKMNRYEKACKNTKVYCEDGNKQDELGRYKWVTEIGYKTKENAFLYGNHEQTSEFMVRTFIPLNLDESVAILHHMGGMAFDSAQDNIGRIFNEYQLALVLYLSDMQATYIDERIS